jgi:kynurenine formamidase
VNDSKFIYLSHFLDKQIPVYGNSAERMTINPIKSISNGDSANTFMFTMENHWGTHIDAPAHFFEKAPAITDYSPEYWFFKNPQVMDISVNEGELINIDAFIGSIEDKTDFLLIRTGFQSDRGKERYSKNNPGIRSNVGTWLRKHHPSMRAIGFDFISLSSFQHRDEGREAHRAFLDPQAFGNPLFIIEDMDLSNINGKLKKVMAFPLMINGVDSSPCTIIGLLE